MALLHSLMGMGKTQQKRIGALDGLRAIAILIVLLYHLTPGKNSNRGLESIILKIADIGWIGVDLFFVLSGFLITSILLRYKHKNVHLRRYFIHRFLRIVPLYFSVIAFVFLLFPIITGLYAVPGSAVQLPYWFYVSNYFDGAAAYNQYFQLGHLWSLAVEMQFYLIWPFIIYYLADRHHIKLSIILILLALVVKSWIVMKGVGWEVTFAWTPFRMDGLLIGAMIAVYQFHNLKIFNSKLLRISLMFLFGLVIAGIAWWGYASAIFKDPVTTNIYLTRVFSPLLASLFFGMLLMEALEKGFISTILSNRPLAFIAKYSYGLYVFHFLFVPMFEKELLPLIKSWLGVTDLTIYIYFLTTSTISLFLAYLSFHLIERRFLLLKDRI